MLKDIFSAMTILMLIGFVGYVFIALFLSGYILYTALFVIVIAIINDSLRYLFD